MRLFLTAFMALLLAVAQAQSLRFHQLTVKDGLPHNGIIALGQDAKGHIWIATYGGLCIYDGRQFISLPTQDLHDKRVNRINLAADGTMWVRCYDHHDQISRYDTLSHRFFTYDLSTLTDSVKQQAVRPYSRTFADPRSSLVWTVEKQLLWQKDTLHPQEQFAYSGQTAIDAGLKDESVNTLLLDSRGILWVGSASNGLFFADIQHSHYHRIACSPTPLVWSVCQDRKGTLWMAIANVGLEKASGRLGDEASGRLWSDYEPVDYPTTDSVEGQHIRAIYEDSKENLWLATYDGLYLKATGKDSFQRIILQKAEGEQVYSLQEDEKGRLWIGAGTGLFLLPAGKRSQQPLLVDSLRRFVLDMAAGRKGLWVATDDGLFLCQNEQLTQWSNKAVRTVTADAAGNVWVGTDEGLCLVTGQGFQHIATPADGHIIKSTLCWRDFLWCCYDLGICCVNIYTRQAIALHTKHNEYVEHSACLDAHRGILFFGGTQGIDCFVADSLDEQLRSAVSQLWLEEESEELRMKGEEQVPHTWLYVMLLLTIGILGCTYYYIWRRKHDETTAEKPESLTPSPFILKATAIAEAHIADTGFTAEQMAQEMAMSRSKLFALMKAETGKAVMEFVRDIRLDYAAKQLKAGSSVNDIYMACGFSDPSSFRRSFARKFGMPPSQYRTHSKEI